MGNKCHKVYLSCSGSAGGAVTPESTRKIVENSKGTDAKQKTHVDQ